MAGFLSRRCGMLATMEGCDFQNHFRSIEDPRVTGRKVHGLLDILFLCVAGTLAGCEGPTDIVEFAFQKLAWGRRVVAFKKWGPSHDTLCCGVALLKPWQIQ